MTVESLITQHIDTWTSAVKTKSTSGRGSSKKLELYGVKKLRELILELAVRGKLVPQDPSDEPASVLLERIAAEKEQLVKEKKIKKPKKLFEISEEEKGFASPVGWEWAHLQDLTTYIQRGKGPKYAESGRVKVVSQKCVQNSGFDLAPARYVTDESLDAYQEERFLRDNDILWNSTGTGTVGRANVINDIPYQKIVADSHVTVIRLTNVYSRFLWCFIMAPGVQSRISPDNENALVSGSTKQVELNTSSVTSLVVPVAPLAEQHRIVAKVDELMALCDQLEQQTEASIEAHQLLVSTLLNTLTNSADADELMENWARISDHFDTLFTTEESIDQLKQTILQMAVMGKLVPFGKTKETSLKSILTFGPRNGFSPKEVPSETNLKVLKLGATSYGELDVEQSKFIDVDVSDKPHLYLKKGDILIQRGNSANFVGSNVLILESYSNIIYPDLMMKLRVNEEVLPEYASLVLSAKSSREHMWNLMTGTSGTMPKISKKVVEGVPVAFPVDLACQKRVIEKYKEQINICNQLKACLKESQITQLHLTDAIVEQVV
ncbi:restriction endonuclease subunit S [Photobacterium damselae subsp. damselae]